MALLSRLQIALSAVACGLLVCSGAAHAWKQATESDVKAAFLYNFTKYIDWPSAAFEDAADSFRICVASDAEFRGSVAGIVAGETARGRPLELIAPRSDLNRCHILFIGRNEAARVGAMLGAIADRPILTVGETPGFLEKGGAVLFEVEDHRVRFDINLEAATRVGLTVSSKLVRVARHVREGGP